MALNISIATKSRSGLFARRKLALFLLSMAVLTSTMQAFARGADEALIPAGTMTASSEATETTEPKNLSLDNIQDLAFTLQRIRQQAINVYVEATRKTVHHFDLNIPSLSSMPATPLEEQSAYLPLRKAWLVFFIGTMEPLVHILNEHLKHLDEKTEKSQMPSQYRPEWRSIVNEWTSAIHELNAQLDICASLLDDPAAGNVEVAKAARSIDRQVSVLENILKRSAEFLRDKLKTLPAGQ